MIVIFHWIFFIIFVLLKQYIIMNGFNENGLKEGPWEEYHDNGKLWYKVNYVNGNFHGLSEWYDSNGKLWYKVNYVNGKRHGFYERYNSNSESYLKQYYL